MTKTLVPIEFNNQRIMTTKVLAEQFGTDEKNISKNFIRNDGRFQEGKHYYKLEGEELKDFKANHLNDEYLKFAPSLYLWTERGVARHAKILETDEAWQVYEILEDTYFKTKERNQFQIPQSFKEALLQLVTAEEEKERLQLEGAIKDQIINELQPKATYYDLILQSKAALSVSQIAKDYGMSATKLNALLHELKVQYSQGGVWLLYQIYASKGYTSSKTHNYINNRDEQCSKLHTYWTQKGRLFIYQLLKEQGILPLMERGVENNGRV